MYLFTERLLRYNWQMFILHKNGKKGIFNYIGKYLVLQTYRTPFVWKKEIAPFYFSMGVLMIIQIYMLLNSLQMCFID